jgi:GNAT superfamily N-acetyltransferase
MSTVRRATVLDVDELVELGRSFVAYSAYGNMVSVSDDDIVRGLCNALDNGVVFVAERNNRIVGGIVGLKNSLWFAPHVKVATELAWWVRPEDRNTPAAVRLLRRFERWAAEQGATHVAMSDLVIDGDTPAGKLFEKLGYTLTERSHIKGV